VPKPILHQVIIGAMIGDAITDEAFLIRRWLHEMGFDSEIFAESIHPDLEGDVCPVSAYRPRSGETHLIYHHSIGCPTADLMLNLPVRLIMIYHNITPPDFFNTLSPTLARQMRQGRAQLLALRARTDMAIADSGYNEHELREAGYTRSGVLPFALDQRFDVPPNVNVLTRLSSRSGPILLFVGRLVPNKRQEDLIKLLYFYRRIEPEACLILAGSPWPEQYARWLKELAEHLGLRDAVLFVGHIAQPDLLTAYYRAASVYASMSEHEGFGRPLIESMYLGLPVLAYTAAAVPDTMGGAGVLFRYKHYEALAEVVDLLVRDTAFRQRIIVRQRERAQLFLERAVRETWRHWLRNVLPEPMI
jgi:glycosyltransferase involved in cell wall biosynthesis